MCCDKLTTTHYFFKYCVADMAHKLGTTQYFLKKIMCCASKIMCCDKLKTTHYFFKKYCVADMAHNTIFF